MQPEPSRPPRRRLALALVAVASLLAFAALFSVWINRQLLNTDNWTAASTEMLDEPVIRDQTARYLSDQIYANVDVEGEIRAALPPRAQPIAGPLAGLLRDRVEKRAREALARPKTQQRWENANRTAHEMLVSALDRGGPVVLDLKALLADVEEQAGVGGRVGQALPADAAQITILDSGQLDLAQDVFGFLEPLAVVLVVLSLGLFGVAVAIAPGYRRRAVRAYGFGLVVAGAGALVATAWLGPAVAGSVAGTAAGEEAVRAVWDIYTRLLEEAAVATIGYGVVMVAGAWLAGPTGWAVAVRRALAPYLREPALAYGALAVILAVVILWWEPTPATRNPVAAGVLVVLVALGLEGLRRQTAREHPDADRGQAALRRRERLGGLVGSVGGGAAAGAGVVSRTVSRFTAPTSDEDLRIDRLQRLESLRAAGVLDDEEFRAEKARILGGAGDAHPTTPVA